MPSQAPVVEIWAPASAEPGEKGEGGRRESDVMRRHAHVHATTALRAYTRHLSNTTPDVQHEYKIAAAISAALGGLL